MIRKLLRLRKLKNRIKSSSIIGKSTHLSNYSNSLKRNWDTGSFKEFETVEEQVGNIQADPHFCDLTVFDAQLVPGHYHTLKLIKKLDLTKIINEKNFHKSFDQYKEYGTSLSFGLTGFAYDSRVIKEEFKDYSFLVDPKYKDKIALLDDNNDFFLCLLSMINFDYETKVDIPSDSIKELESLSPKISKNNPFISDTFANLDALVEQKVLFAHTYSGDFISYQKDHPHIKFIIPDFGLNAWSEIITLSHNAPNKENAYKLLNFLSSRLKLLLFFQMNSTMPMVYSARKSS